MITVLMQIGRLSFNPDIAKLLADVSWKSLNEQFKRDYDKAINHILDGIEAKGEGRTGIMQEVDKIYAQVGALNLKRAQRRRRPPKEEQLPESFIPTAAWSVYSV